MISTCSRADRASGPLRVYPLPSVALLGEGGRGDPGDVGRVDHGDPAAAGRVDDLACADGVAPPEGVGGEGVGPQIGHGKTGFAHDLLTGGESGPDGVLAQRFEPRADGREQDDPRCGSASCGIDHRLGLGGAAADSHQEDGFDAGDRLRHVVGVVEVTDDALDAGGQVGRSGEAAHHYPYGIALVV
nr:hypothetical protein GCM10020092_090360 [Actinoplanes digitatis]